MGRSLAPYRSNTFSQQSENTVNSVYRPCGPGPIQSRKPDTKFWEAETEAEAGRKTILQSKPRLNPSKTACKEAEAETEANSF